MAKNDKRKFSLAERLKSIANAFSGIAMMIRNEHNFRIHIVILLLVVTAGFVLRITSAEWIVISIVAGMVLSAECFNSAIEYLADEVSPGYNEKIKKLKDIAAAGVLISAIIAIIAGLLIFVPGIIQFISSK